MPSEASFGSYHTLPRPMPTAPSRVSTPVRGITPATALNYERYLGPGGANYIAPRRVQPSLPRTVSTDVSGRSARGGGVDRFGNYFDPDATLSSSSLTDTISLPGSTSWRPSTVGSALELERYMGPRAADKFRLGYVNPGYNRSSRASSAAGDIFQNPAYDGSRASTRTFSDDSFRTWRHPANSLRRGSSVADTLSIGSSGEPLIEGLNAVPRFGFGVARLRRPHLPKFRFGVARVRRPQLPQLSAATKGKMKRFGKAVAQGTMSMLPVAAAVGTVGAAAAIGAAGGYEGKAIDNTRYEVRGEGQQKILDSINTEPPAKKVRFEEEIDFSKPEYSGRRPSRFATRTREPGYYDFSTPSRGATRQTEPGYDFSTPSRFATRRFEPGHYD
jgi:hypothetical protein